MRPAPLLSVILFHTGGTGRRDAIEALASQLASRDGELILVEPPDGHRRSRPPVERLRIVTCEADATLPQRYCAALRESRGAVVATTTDRFLAGDRWLDRISDRLGAGDPERAVVVTGPINLHPSAPATTAAVYCCEYATNASASLATAAPVANLAMTRAACRLLLDQAPTWDADWAGLFRRGGASIVVDTERPVYLSHHFGLWAFICERFHFSRVLTAARVSLHSLPYRLIRASTMVLLPPLLFFRIAKRSMGTVPTARWVMLLPRIALLTLPWALGDIVGAVAGSGRSARSVG